MSLKIWQIEAKMKITKRQLRKIIREADEKNTSRLMSHMVDALVAYLRSEDMLLSTDEVTDWLLDEFSLPRDPVPHGLIDRVLNDVRLDDLYEPRDDAWGQSEVPYAGPGDGSTARGLTTGWAVQETDDKSRRVGGGQAWGDEESEEDELNETKIRVTQRQLRKLIKEAIIAEAGYGSLPYKDGRPWEDPDMPVGRGADVHDDPLDRDLTDKEMDDAGYFEEDGWPLTFGYTDENGEKVEFIANNDAESEQFFSMFFKKYGRDYPYSVN
jgi:hypothetical protein